MPNKHVVTFFTPSQADGTTQKDICKEILEQWESTLKAILAAKESKSGEAVSVDMQIARIMEQQALCVVPQKKQTDEEKKLKQSILTQYAQVFGTDWSYTSLVRAVLTQPVNVLPGF